MNISDSARIRALEVEVQYLKDDIKEVKELVKPLADAFQRAKGFTGAMYVFGTIALLGLGAGAKSIWEWLRNGLGL
jgi:hypothetical protein